MRVGVQRHASAVLPPRKTRYSLYRMLGGPQGRSGQVRNNSPPPGFDPRTVQTVVSRYTDWAITVHLLTTAAEGIVGKFCDFGKLGENDEGHIWI
jgi:hypothetical protein